MGLLGGSKFVLQGKWAVTARCGGVRAPRPTVGRVSGYKGKAAGRRGRRPLQLKDKAVLRAPCGQIERGKGGRQPSPNGTGGAEPRPYGHPISPSGGSERLAAHNERRQPAKLARSCGCLPRRGKHCSLPQFRSAQLWPLARNPATPEFKVEQSTRALRTNGNTAFV